MTATTAPDTQADYDDADAPGICWECGGPCLTHKGSVHRWRCQSCIDRYLDEGAARWAARSDKAKERVSRTLLHNNDNRTLVTANGQRQEAATANRRWSPRAWS